MPRPATRTAGDKREILTDLYELIEALDRHLLQLERVGQLQFAHHVADLRHRAVSLIQWIEDDDPME